MHHEMNVRRMPIAARGRLLLFVLAALTLPAGCRRDPDAVNGSARVLPGGFLVRPYLQLGDDPAAARGGSIRVLWHTEDIDDDWVLESLAGGDGDDWRPAAAARWRRMAVEGIAPHRVYRADLSGLPAGKTFGYRLRRRADVVFTAEAPAPRSAGQPFRLAIFGDCGAGTAEEKAVAFQAYRERPHLLLIPGDVVYTRGRVAEYRQKFWPVYDCDRASTGSGAPLLRSTLVVTVPGNHDVGGRDLNQFPDGMAYFAYWDQPLNGPLGRERSPLAPPLVASEARRAAFLQAAGPAFPRMANFSFDYGDAHWTVLDTNAYVNFTDAELRGWIERDLAAAKGATWRFVTFHHPPFNSSHAHFGDQRTRLLADLFQAGGVNVVWTGHVHNYQRTHPLTFKLDRGPDGRPARVLDRVPGRWTLDTEYDGRTRTRPRGVIYVTTGAGGASLYNLEQDADPGSWQAYTSKFISRVNSLTIADIDGPTLTVRQIAADGRELDRFIVTKDLEPGAGSARN